MRRALCALLLAALLPLAACVEPTTSGGSVGPGPGKVDLASATLSFNQVCLATMPNLNNARQVLAAGPYQQHSSTGTYYHRALDMSFKLRTEGGRPVCSMVVGTTENPGALNAAITAQPAAKGVTISPGVILPSGGRAYVSFFAIGPG